ncbi:hypothetical protein ACOBWL_003469 [Vibrio cholerae]|nr:hypothetical protein [Vibrio cholerae]EHS7465964.1 hypothetical protein [Vibrio cholerae]EJL6445660.1 hypothetical protein [Vibrio cholerae]EJU9032456.1 hypothetical protein [Vibrio cholerae]
MESQLEIPLYIFKIGQNSGVTIIDLLLITLCPLAGLIGTLVSSVMQRKQIAKAVPQGVFIEQELVISSDDSFEDIQKKKNELRNSYDRFIFEESRLATRGNTIIGFALGLVVSLYFFGAITQDMTSLARVVGLCILLGYQAPNIWSAQEKVISNIVEKKILEAINNASKPRT